MRGTPRYFLLAFLLALSFGYAVGFLFIQKTTGLESDGIESRINGNENDGDAETFQFKKPEAEILTLIHNHVLSLSLIFLAMGVLVLMSELPPLWKKILVVEPFLSLVLTFGGIWLVWYGLTWFRYIIMVSGCALHASFAVSCVVLLRDLLRGRKLS